MNTLDKIIKDFKKTPDLIHKTININNNYIDILYLETITSSSKINDFLLKDLILILSNKKKINSLNSYLADASIKKISEKEIEFYLTNGFAIILFKNEIYISESRQELNRSITTANVEASIKGPQDAFVENYQINIGLIKRRIKDKHLKTENIILGNKTKTEIGLMYIDDIADKKNIEYIKNHLNNIKVDGILDSSDIAKLLDGDTKTTFPTIKETERPDNVATSLLDGKIALIIDTSPYVLIAPSFLSDFINPTHDKYTKTNNINFIKILRFICFFISMLAPGIYIALSTFNQETLPTKILINFAVQREGVPFPAPIETLIMLIVCEILRESDLRFPSIYGSAISILGALILGEASVSAGIVSPIIIIVVALSFIASLIFTDINLINTIRNYRFLFLISSSFLGLYGLILAFIFFLIKLVSVKSIGLNYTIPLSPFDLTYLKETLIQVDYKKENKRSKVLTKNIIRKDIQ